MRARYPDREGFADLDGARVFFEVFGEGEPTLVLVPANPIVHSRQWKAQVHLARHYRVVTFDGRGNGRSDRPADPAAYTERAYLAELAAVLDATGSGRVVLVGLCQDGVWRSLWFAADHPERVAGVVAVQSPGTVGRALGHHARTWHEGRLWQPWVPCSRLLAQPVTV